MIHTLSFDIENWTQGFIQRGLDVWQGSAHSDRFVIEKLLDTLDENDTRATFFVLGKFAEEAREVVKGIAARKHEIASHSCDHRSIPEHSPVSFRNDLRRSISILQDITGSPVRGFRAPRWSLNRKNFWALDVMFEEGIVYDSSIYPTGLHSYGYRNAKLGPCLLALGSGQSIAEFPAQVLSWGPIRIPVAGGFYLRAFPLFLSKWALKQSEKEGYGGMVYLHPYDLDLAAPRLKVPFMFRVIRYYNLKKTEDRLRVLLKTFQFSAIEDVLTASRNTLPTMYLDLASRDERDKQLRTPANY